MLNYYIISICTCFIFDKIFTCFINKQANKNGYIYTKKDHIIKFYYFIPFINNLFNLLELFCGVYAMRKKNILVELFDKTPGFSKASKIRGYAQYLDKRYNLDAIKEAMILDGATDKIIKNEIKEIKKELNEDLDLVKKLDKINAMADADLWLLDIEMTVGLSQEEKRILYLQYVKDFLSKKDNYKTDTPQKTLELINNRMNK